MAVDVAEMSTSTVPIGNSTDDILVEGDSFYREFTYEYSEDDGVTWNAVNLTGYVGACQVRDKSGALIATLTVSALDSTGIFTLTLATLPAVGSYDYDTEIVSGSTKRTLQRGPFVTSRQATE